MAKKDNLKFKKRIKSQILQEISQGQIDTPKNAPISAKPIISSTPSPTPAKNVEPNVSQIKTGDNIELVRSDLKKSAIIIGSIIIIIVAIYFIDNKTGFLLKASDQLFNTLNLNA